MIIYKPLIAYDHECINCLDDNDYEIFNKLDGSSKLDAWRPIRVDLGPADERQKGLPSDFPWLGSHALVMRHKAVAILRDILDAHGELLPLVTDDGVELQAFNARTVDALDQGRASVMRFPSSNRIMYIERVAFIEPAIRGLDIFRLPHRGSPTYVSQRFVERVAEGGLVGLDFDEAWRSD